MLSDEQIERYSRQIIVPGIGSKQERLLSASVAILSAGPAAQTAAVYLAAGGVGELRLSGDAEHGESLRRQLDGIGVDCTVRTHPYASEEPRPQIRGSAVAVADDLARAAAVNSICVALGVPLLVAWEETGAAQVAMFAGHRPDSPCVNCQSLATSPAGPGDERRAPSASASFAGTIVATEALKWILDVGTPLTGRQLSCDWRRAGVTESVLRKNPDCSVCGTRGVRRTQGP